MSFGTPTKPCLFQDVQLAQYCIRNLPTDELHHGVRHAIGYSPPTTRWHRYVNSSNVWNAVSVLDALRSAQGADAVHRIWFAATAPSTPRIFERSPNSCVGPDSSQMANPFARCLLSDGDLPTLLKCNDVRAYVSPRRYRIASDRIHKKFDYVQQKPVSVTIGNQVKEKKHFPIQIRSTAVPDHLGIRMSRLHGRTMSNAFNLTTSDCSSKRTSWDCSSNRTPTPT